MNLLKLTFFHFVWKQLSDFGLAVTDAGQNKNNLKLSGTLGYLAPEYLLDGMYTNSPIIAQLILIGCYSYYSIISFPSLGVNKKVLLDPIDFNFVFTCSDLNKCML